MNQKISLQTKPMDEHDDFHGFMKYQRIFVISDNHTEPKNFINPTKNPSISLITKIL